MYSKQNIASLTWFLLLDPFGGRVKFPPIKVIHGRHIILFVLTDSILLAPGRIGYFRHQTLHASSRYRGSLLSCLSRSCNLVSKNSLRRCDDSKQTSVFFAVIHYNNPSQQKIHKHHYYFCINRAEDIIRSTNITPSLHITCLFPCESISHHY